MKKLFAFDKCIYVCDKQPEWKDKKSIVDIQLSLLPVWKHRSELCSSVILAPTYIF